MDANTFNRTLYSGDDGDFEIKYDSRSKFVTFIRARKLIFKEFVNLSVNTSKILIALIAPLIILSKHEFINLMGTPIYSTIGEIIRLLEGVHCL